MPLVGRGGPGLVRGVARTAVVAGTATAVSGRVNRRQQRRWDEEENQATAEAAPEPPPAAPAPSPDDPVAQIERLAALQEQGQLTPEEFTEMKAKILAG